MTAYEAMVELERKRAELDHARRAQTPGAPEYATGAINELWPTPAHFVSQLGIPGASDVAEYQAARSEGLGVLPALGLAALPFGIGYGVKGALKAAEPMLRGGPELPGINPEMAALQAALGGDPATQTSALMGVKRIPKLYHSARGGPEAIESIKEKGFTRGVSAEIKTPGTSLSEDPYMSVKYFAPGSADQFFPADTRSHEDRYSTVAVEPKGLRAQDVHNLPPSAYLSGDLPKDPQAFYRKPGAFYHEAETFARREPGTLEHTPPPPPDVSVRDLTAEEWARVKGTQRANRQFEGGANSIFAAAAELRRFGNLPGKAVVVDMAEGLRKLRGDKATFSRAMDRVAAGLRSLDIYGDDPGQAILHQVYGKTKTRTMRAAAFKMGTLMEAMNSRGLAPDAVDNSYRQYIGFRNYLYDELQAGAATGRKPKMVAPGRLP